MPQLLGRVHIPVALWQELHAGDALWPGREEVDKAPWIVRERVRPGPLLSELAADLGPGESEAIVLALELKSDVVLLDEKEGRRVAQRVGLKVMGVGRNRREAEPAW
jgi:uncharacterized protein